MGGLTQKQLMDPEEVMKWLKKQPITYGKYAEKETKNELTNDKSSSTTICR